MRFLGKTVVTGMMLASAIAVAMPAQAATTITVTGKLGGTLSIDGVYNNVSFGQQAVTLTGISDDNAPVDFGAGFSGYRLSSLKLGSLVAGSPGTVDFGADYVYGGGNGSNGFGTLANQILFAFNGANLTAGSTTPAFFTASNADFTNRPGSVTFSEGSDFSAVVATSVSAVPEPATWLTLVLGFGIVGAAMRRRQRNVATTVRFA